MRNLWPIRNNICCIVFDRFLLIKYCFRSMMGIYLFDIGLGKTTIITFNQTFYLFIRLSFTRTRQFWAQFIHFIDRFGSILLRFCSFYIVFIFFRLNQQWKFILNTILIIKLCNGRLGFQTLIQSKIFTFRIVYLLILRFRFQVISTRNAQ